VLIQIHFLFHIDLIFQKDNCFRCTMEGQQKTAWTWILIWKHPSFTTANSPPSSIQACPSLFTCSPAQLGRCNSPDWCLYLYSLPFWLILNSHQIDSPEVVLKDQHCWEFFIFYFLFFLERGPQYVVQADLELLILLPQPPQYWDHWDVPLCLNCFYFLRQDLTI
jgi:hypothetical protein